MHPEDQEKTTFVAEVMMFGLKTAPAMFQRIITEIFNEYIRAFMQVFFDDFAVYGQRLEQWPSYASVLIDVDKLDWV